MRPWMGAVAVTAAILAAPAVALAGEDDPAQLQFKLPNAEAVHDFEKLGLNMDHGMQRHADGTARSSARGPRTSRPRWRSCTATKRSGRSPRKYAIDAIRAERNTKLAGLKRAKTR